MVFVMPNKFKQPCMVCQTPVPEKKGFAVKSSGWFTLCPSSQCIASQPKSIRDAIHSKVNQVPRKEINRLGEIFSEPYCPTEKDLIKTLPEARWNSAKRCWRVSLHARDRAVIVDAMTRMGYTMPQGFDQVSLEADPNVAEAVARAKRGGAYPYQLDGVEFLSAREDALMGDDMGLGKTLQSLMALPSADRCRAIVVCPSSLKLNWSKEVGKWRSDLTPIVCKGRKGRNAFRLPNVGEVIIINYDILPTWLDSSEISSETAQILAETQLIVDEAHYVKNHKAKRSKRMTALATLCKGSWAMSGTPLMTRPLDLWGVLSTFGMERQVFGSWGNFVKGFNGSKGRYGYEWGSAEPSVAERLKRVMIRRLKTEVLKSLPPKRHQDVLIPISKTLAKATRDAFAIIRQNKDELPHFSQFSELRKALAESRIPHLIEMVESYEESDEPVVVFSDHRSPVEALGEREGWATILGDTPISQRQRAVEAFQRGELKGIALTIGAGSTGLTLTRASTMIFCDLSWTPSINAQAEDRICRIGQEAHSLMYIRLVSDCEMDVHCTNLLTRKAQMITTAIDGQIDLSKRSSQSVLMPQIIEESREERDARFRLYRQEEARQQIESRRDDLESRVQSVTRPITAEIREQIITALELMASWCDGAVERDGSGFSASDQNLKWLGLSGVLSDPSETALVHFAWEGLKKYKGQLYAHTPLLWS